VFEIAGVPAATPWSRTRAARAGLQGQRLAAERRHAGDARCRSATAWTPPYAFTPRPAALVKANALAQAGGGKLTTAITGTGKVTIDTVTITLNCPPPGLYFCDDFQNGSSSKWNLLPVAGAERQLQRG
jgi:hypothetical protein